eukprot:CAMPEP_0170497006 /NCGR_PEP_ID=MMETSP0208-20121228/23405_1 /TAXON_ID=197538 /ORGANISM="Strombidium inclinatum, Strain S3" /LENGTH=35 /DNA_ID= /DNA_START= /DNA_END= /DNA_ORIENTATION=
MDSIEKKLVVHGQDEWAARLNYLSQELHKRKDSFK